MRRLIRWFTANPVAANLLLVMIVAAGLLAINHLRREVMPDPSLDQVRIVVPYRGATPAEVEQSVLIPIEERLFDLEGIDRLHAIAEPNRATILIELQTGHDPQRMLEDVKARIDAIDNFPEQTEQPIVERLDQHQLVMAVAISGDLDEMSLRRLAERFRDDLTAHDTITQVQLVGIRPFEIAIEVPEQALKKHGLLLDDVVAAIRRSSLDMPAGTIKTDAAHLTLRTRGQAYHGDAFERIALLTHHDGTQLHLGEIAHVIDGFEEQDHHARFNGKPAVLVTIHRAGDQDTVTIAQLVHEQVAAHQANLPDAVSMTIFTDESRYFVERLDLMSRNALSGLLLVIAVLALFLRLRLAVWVALSIPVSFLGTIWLMPMFDVSLNMVSMFAFILALGVVVDNAVVVGESIHAWQERGLHGQQAVNRAVREVITPVFVATVTSVAAFVPLLLITGVNGNLWRIIPLIAIPTLLFSLVKSLLILPANLTTHAPPDPSITGIGRRLQNLATRGMQRLTIGLYRPMLNLSLRMPALTVAVFTASLLLTAGFVGSGRVEWRFFPTIESDSVFVQLSLPDDTPAHVTRDMLEHLEQAALSLDASNANATPLIRNISTVLETGQRGRVQLELTPNETRTQSSSHILARWREAVGPMPDAVQLRFEDAWAVAGEAINLQLVGPNLDELATLADTIRSKLATYAGVQDVTDSFHGGTPELELTLRPGIEPMGLSQAHLARQVRQGFYGEQAQRIQRGRDDVRVMVRYPRDQRTSVADLETMRIRQRDAQGRVIETPLADVAEVTFTTGLARIERLNRSRSISVTADVAPGFSPDAILADLQAGFLPELLADHPAVRYELDGEQREQQRNLNELAYGMALALLVIYALVAVPFRSYLQPVIVLLAVPFGLVGAVWGHMMLGLDLTVLSLCGMVALAGVVVNASLVLIDRINQLRSQGMGLHEALQDAGTARFRPILLTALTTFVGLIPLILERSAQAQFLIPMAVSLAFGVLYGTLITLLFVPACYQILAQLGIQSTPTSNHSSTQTQTTTSPQQVSTPLELT